MPNRSKKYAFQVRVTGIVIENESILIVKQRLEHRNWSLPGGRLEQGESINTCLIREIREETGLDVSLQKLLYITEIPEKNLIHMTYLCNKDSGTIRLPSNEYDENPILDVRFVPVNQLSRYGFREEFQEIVKEGFPGSGTYQGKKENIGL